MAEQAWRNPVHDGYLADPFVFCHGGVFFAIGTGQESAELSRERQRRVLPMLRSPDCVQWEALGPVVEVPASARGAECWAPAIAESAGLFHCYYSLGDARIPKHQLRHAIARQPEGPYEDRGALTPGSGVAFAIDAHPFQDRDGQWWLFYARDFLDHDHGQHPGTGIVCDRLIGMSQLAGKERVVVRPRHDWTLFQSQRLLYGRIWDWHTVEGPCVVLHDGRYYCFYSGACFGNATYGVDYVTSDDITGPWDDAGSAAGPRVLRSIAQVVLGPGHNSCFVGPDGQEYLAYHAWDSGRTVRRMHIDRLLWTPLGPRCRPTGATASR